MAVESPIFDISDVLGETVEYLGKERSRYVLVGPFLAAEVADQYGNIYAFKPQPISVHQTFRYLDRHEKRRFSHGPNPDQSVLFEDVIQTEDYVRKVEPLGIKSNLSGSSFLLRVIPLTEGKILEDALHAENKGKKRKRERRLPQDHSFQITGKLDEIRKGKQPTIVRVIESDRTPGRNDAICLSLDWLVLQSIAKRLSVKELNPLLKVFNARNGKLYEAKLDTARLVIEAIKALEFGDLAERADYKPEPVSDIAEIKPQSVVRANVDASRVIVIDNDNLVKETLTAEEAFKKGESAIKRIRGDLPYTERLYNFFKFEEVQPSS